MKRFLLLLLVCEAANSETYLKTRPREIALAEKKISRQTTTVLDYKYEARQTDSVGIGILTGSNFSFASADPSRAGSTRNGWSFRGFFDLPVSRTFSIELGGGYVQRGVNTTLLQLGILGITGEIRLFYMEASALFKLRTRMLSDQLELWAGTGPSLGYAVIRNLETKVGIQSDLTERFDSNDFLLAVGGGAAYSLSTSSRILFQSRFSYGLKDIDLSPDSTYSTRGLEVLLGFGFLLK